MNATKTDIRFTPPDDEDARALRVVMDVMRVFRDESPTIPVSYAMAFLLVALKPGGGSTDYMNDLDTIQPIMSRILLALGHKERRKPLGESGADLIDFAPDPLDLRRNRTYLTPKGQRLMRKVVEATNRLKR